MKKIGLPMLLTAIMSLTIACSTDDADAYSYTDKTTNYMADEEGAIYEGEWTVNQQVVDTARLVVANNMLQLRLPEDYLFSTYILPRITSENGAYEFDNDPIDIHVAPQGYSETSQYMSFSSETLQSNDSPRWYTPGSFLALGSTPYQILLLSKENATAVYQNTTGQWTLGIPIDGFLLTNLFLSTHQSELMELPITVTIYYNTKRRIY